MRYHADACSPQLLPVSLFFDAYDDAAADDAAMPDILMLMSPRCCCCDVMCRTRRRYFIDAAISQHLLPFLFAIIIERCLLH